MIQNVGYKIKYYKDIFLIKRHIKRLESEKELERFHLRCAYPKAAEKMDNIDLLKPELFDKLNSKIEAYKRLLNKKRNEHSKL